MVSTLIDRDTKRWKANLVKSLFLPFEANIVLNIPLNHNLPNDKIIWVGNKKGEFTMKSAYYIAIQVIEVAKEGRSKPFLQYWAGLPPAVLSLSILSKRVETGPTVTHFDPACAQTMPLLPVF